MTTVEHLPGPVADGELVAKLGAAFQDARNSVLIVQSREQLLRLGDQLAEAALDLCDAHTRLLAAHDDLLDDVEVFTDGSLLGRLVREEHDHNHPDPWSICGFEICRQAAFEGQS